MRKIVFFFIVLFLLLLSVNLVRGASGEIVENMSKTYVYLHNGFTNFFTGVENTYQDATDTVDSINKSIDEKVQQVNGAVDQINKTVQQAQNAIDELNKTKEAVSEVFQ